jgi:hypothetical protein
VVVKVNKQEGRLLQNGGCKSEQCVSSLGPLFVCSLIRRSLLIGKKYNTNSDQDGDDDLHACTPVQSLALLLKSALTLLSRPRILPDVLYPNYLFESLTCFRVVDTP